MGQNNIEARLAVIFKKVLNISTIDITEKLSADDIEEWNSLSHMLLIVEIEKEFAIKFKLKDLNKMKNVGDMINIIESKIDF